jgi:hypothetical protein
MRFSASGRFASAVFFGVDTLSWAGGSSLVVICCTAEASMAQLADVFFTVLWFAAPMWESHCVKGLVAIR